MDKSSSCSDSSNDDETISDSYDEVGNDECLSSDGEMVYDDDDVLETTTVNNRWRAQQQVRHLCTRPLEQFSDK